MFKQIVGSRLASVGLAGAIAVGVLGVGGVALAEGGSSSSPQTAIGSRGSSLRGGASGRRAQGLSGSVNAFAGIRPLPKAVMAASLSSRKLLPMRVTSLLKATAVSSLFTRKHSVRFTSRRNVG